MALKAADPDGAQSAEAEVVGEQAVFDPLGLGGPGASAGQDIDQVMQQQALWMAAKTGDVFVWHWSSAALQPASRSSAAA